MEKLIIPLFTLIIMTVWWLRHKDKLKIPKWIFPACLVACLLLWGSLLFLYLAGYPK